MDQAEILETLSEIEGGERVKIYPTTENTSTTHFQPTSPFETKVLYVDQEETRHDTYTDMEAGETKRFDSTTHTLHLDPHPNDDEADEYRTGYKWFFDGHKILRKISRVQSPTSERERHGSISSVASIEKIEIL